MRDDLERAVALVREGFSYGKAAKEVGGITRNAVAGACGRAGVLVGHEGRECLRKGHPRADLAAALYRQGWPYLEIARVMGLAHARSVSSMLRRAGQSTANRKRGPKPKNASGAMER